MPTLRTVKELHGPDAALLHLTFQAWFEAQFGEEAFRRLHLIDRGQWMDYLVWLRRVMQVPVRNDTLVDDIVPAAGLLHVRMHGPQGEATLAARRVVLAGGYEGHGGPRIPAFMDALPRRHIRQTRLTSRRCAAGASVCSARARQPSTTVP